MLRTERDSATRSIFPAKKAGKWAATCLETATAPAPHSSREVRAERFTAYQGAVIVIASMGILLRAWQYLSKDSYFMDEIAVLRNLMDKPWRELLIQPLAYGQTAPPGFLLVEKLLYSTTGSTEYSLRLFPFLCSVASVIVFAKLVRGLLSGAAALASLAIFATAGPLILYGAQLKQYSADILCACLLCLAATRYVKMRGRSAAYIFGITGAVVVWFSQPAVIVLGSMAALLLADEVRRMRSAGAEFDRSILAALMIAGVSAAGSTLYAIHLLTPETREYLAEFWQNGFLPSHLPTSLANLWPYAQLHSFYGGSWGVAIMGYSHPGGFTILTAIGLIVLTLLRKMPGALIAAPVFFTLVASAARQYPFADRTILFLVPSFIIALVVSVETLASIVGQHWRRAINIVILSVLVGYAAYPVVHQLPPYHFEHLRSVIEYVASHREPDDKLYVYYGAVPAFSYYGPRYGLAGSRTILGSCDKNDPRQYFREIDQLRGSRRVWIIIAHPLLAWHERDNLLRYLDALGVRRSLFSVPPRTWAEQSIFHPVEVEQYDLSALAKGDNIAASTFPMLAAERATRWGCAFGPLTVR